MQQTGPAISLFGCGGKLGPQQRIQAKGGANNIS